MALASIENLSISIASVIIDNLVLRETSIIELANSEILTWISEGIEYEEAPGDTIQNNRVNRFHCQEYVNVDMVYEKGTEYYYCP